MVQHQSCKLKIEGSNPSSDLIKQVINDSNLSYDLIKRINKCARNSVNYSMSRHCAVIFSKKGEFVCMSNNHHEKHAEMRVLQKYFSHSSFYGKGIGYMLVVRVNKTGKWNYSAPCIKCVKLLERFDIKFIPS
jgi:hypothetical protein